MDWWCRVDLNYFSNPKTIELSDKAKLAYIYILCRNGDGDHDGIVPNREVFGKAFCVLLGCSDAEREDLTAELTRHRMIVSDAENVTIVGWDDTWRRAKTGTERSRKSRARKTRNGSATPCNALPVADATPGATNATPRGEERREDKNRKEERYIRARGQVARAKPAGLSPEWVELLLKHGLSANSKTPKELGLASTVIGRDAACWAHRVMRFLSARLAELDRKSSRTATKPAAKLCLALVKSGHGEESFLAVLNMRTRELLDANDHDDPSKFDETLKWFTASTILAAKNFERTLEQAHNVGYFDEGKQPHGLQGEETPVAHRQRDATSGPVSVGGMFAGVLDGMMRSADTRPDIDADDSTAWMNDLPEVG